MDAMTTHKRDFTQKPIDLQKTAKKEYTRKSPGKFEADPSYKADYRKWSLPRTEKITHDPGYKPPSAPFQGDSNYHTDYITHRMAAPRESMRPVENAKVSDEPFQKDTDYRQTYIKHPLQPREMKEKPVYEPNKSKLDGLSNYMKDYIPKEQGKQSTCKPDSKPYQSDAPFQDDTTQRMDYKKWPTERPWVREQEQWTKPDGQMNTDTTTHTDYTKKPIERAVMIKPAGQHKTPGKFCDDTNYKADFRKWTPGERPKVTMKNEYAAPQAPFEGNSNYQTDYIKKYQPPRSSMRPAAGPAASDQPFDGRTGYRDEFISHPLQERQQREKAVWEPNKTKLDGTSNYMRDFLPKEAGKMPSCKPDRGAYQSNAPFEGDTTQRMDFKQWPAERPWVRQQDAWVQPDGEMFMNTTTNTDYTKKNIDRAKMLRPDAGRKTPGKFNGTTNYNEDFRKWAPGERAKPKPLTEYSPPEAPFQGSSNYHDDFTKHRLTPVRSLKPSDKGYASDAPFQSGTEYRQEFTKKAAPECPAVVIEKLPSMRSGFAFKEQDQMGHKWYEPVAASMAELPMSIRGASPKQTAISVA